MHNFEHIWRLIPSCRSPSTVLCVPNRLKNKTTLCLFLCHWTFCLFSWLLSLLSRKTHLYSVIAIKPDVYMVKIFFFFIMGLKTLLIFFWSVVIKGKLTHHFKSWPCASGNRSQGTFLFHYGSGLCDKVCQKQIS